VDVLASPDPTNTGYVVRLHDVTEQITAQREIHGFHNIIAHKIGTPLSGISVSLQLLKMALGKYKDADIQEQVEIAWESYQRLADDFAKIRQYLDVSDRVSTNEGFPLTQLSETVARISGALTIKDVEMSVPLDIQDKKLNFSSWTMDILLWEIFENTQKHHPTHSPKVEIEATAVDKNHISIKIMDHGLTLPPEQLAKVWIPYYQGEKHFTGEVPGMGLGLAIVATLVWSIGGKCYLRNRTDSAGVVVELLVPVHNSLEVTQ
jgi:K+-sensing histidine kinase KdpD